jgi:DNA gyrase subunit A
MRLQRLTGLERDKIVADYGELLERIADLMDILARPERITEMIVDELTGIRAQFGDKRRSQIVTHTQDLGIEDLITPVDMVVTLSHTGYIKSQPLADYRAQRRGGRGKQAAAMKADDFVDHLFVANTHDFILCFTNRGRVYWLKVYEVPQGTRTSRGKPIVNLFPLRGWREDQRHPAGQGVRRGSLHLHVHRQRHGEEDAAVRFLQSAQGRHHRRRARRG